MILRYQECRNGLPLSGFDTAIKQVGLSKKEIICLLYKVMLKGNEKILSYQKRWQADLSVPLDKQIQDKI